MLELHSPASPHTAGAHEWGAAGVNHAWMGPPPPRTPTVKASAVPWGLAQAPAGTGTPGDGLQPAQRHDRGPCCTFINESFGRWGKGDKAGLWRGGWCLIGGFQSLLVRAGLQPDACGGCGLCCSTRDPAPELPGRDCPCFWGNNPSELLLNSSGGRQRKRGSGCGAARAAAGLTGGLAVGQCRAPNWGRVMG